jgi:hypothetical protein
VYIMGRVRGTKHMHMDHRDRSMEKRLGAIEQKLKEAEHLREEAATTKRRLEKMEQALVRDGCDAKTQAQLKELAGAEHIASDREKEAEKLEEMYEAEDAPGDEKDPLPPPPPGGFPPPSPPPSENEEARLEAE